MLSKIFDRNFNLQVFEHMYTVHILNNNHPGLALIYELSLVEIRPIGHMSHWTRIGQHSIKIDQVSDINKYRTSFKLSNGSLISVNQIRKI